MPANNNNMVPEPELRNFPPISHLIKSVLIMVIINTIFTLPTMLIVHYYPQLFLSNAHLTVSNHTTLAVAADCNAALLLNKTNHSSQVSFIYTPRPALLVHFYTTPFVQPQMNETGLGVKDVLGSHVVEALKKDVERGSLRPGMRVEGTISWKTDEFVERSYFVMAYSGDLVFQFSGGPEVGVFLSVGRECNVNLY